MLTLRNPIQRFCLIATLTLFAGIIAGSPPSAAVAGQPRLFGLTIGVNDYPGQENDLAGAVADARDIALTLRRLGAVHVDELINGAASKSAIAERWRALVARARAGDTIVMSFAGMGGVEPAPPERGNGANAQNENFFLPGYRATGPASNERIVDDELFDWFLQAERKAVTVLFVADSCHNGALMRRVANHGLRLRAGNFPAPIEDHLLLPPIEIARMTPADFKHVLFLRATQPGNCITEIPISGTRRGALSWAFSRGIEGGADDDRDGEITLGELSRYMSSVIAARTEAQQQPEIAPPRAPDRRLFTYDLGYASPDQALSPTPALKVYIEQGGITALNGLPYVVPVSSPDEADLIWNAATGDVSHIVGGRVATGITRQELPFVVSKWSAIKWLQNNARYMAPFQLPRGTHRYPVGAEVTVMLSGGRLPYLTLFNLPPDGKVQFFIPDKADPGEASADWRQRVFKEGFAVSDPPFGAEHMIAIFTEEVAHDLHKLLREMNTPEKALALRQALEQSLAGRKFQLGVASIYTGNDP